MDTLLEKLVLVLPSSSSSSSLSSSSSNTFNPTVVRLGRVGGDTHENERAGKQYLQGYELDGIVDRAIEKYRREKGAMDVVESEGYLRKQFERDFLMGARVVRTIMMMMMIIVIFSYCRLSRRLPLLLTPKSLPSSVRVLRFRL